MATQSFPKRVALLALLAFLAALLNSATSLAQDCNQENITLAQQSEVDDFQATYGFCTRIMGELVIGHYGDIVSLDALADLQIIEGNLTISNNKELVSVSGLATLARVGGKLEFYGNDKLVNLDGMTELAEIGHELRFAWNESLVDFSALHGLNQIGQSEYGSSVVLNNNASLTNVDGLIGLDFMPGTIDITGNDSLTHLGGLGNVTEIGGTLHINSNRSLENTFGLAKLNRIGGNLRVDVNASLVDLALPRLVSVEDFIEITFNESLVSIGDLDELEQVGQWVYINHNPVLQSLSLSGLYYLWSSLEIRDNPALINLDGLTNLSEVGGSLWINGNGSLSNITGLTNLRRVGGNFELTGNHSMASLEGLENLISAGSVEIQANSQLSDCSALSRLLDPVDDPPHGPGEALSLVPDVAGPVTINNNYPVCNSRLEVLASTPVFEINSGMNDAWLNWDTDGQGFLIVVYPQVRTMFLSWFTFDTERPPDDVTAFLGEPGHRWLTAQGEYFDNQAVLTVWVSRGGIFDSPYPKPVLDDDGEMIVEFDTCNSGTISYVIPSIGLQGTVPIERIALDNAAYCAALNPRQNYAVDSD